MSSDVCCHLTCACACATELVGEVRLLMLPRAEAAARSNGWAGEWVRACRHSCCIAALTAAAAAAGEWRSREGRGAQREGRRQRDVLRSRRARRRGMSAETMASIERVGACSEMLELVRSAAGPRRVAVARSRRAVCAGRAAPCVCSGETMRAATQSVYFIVYRSMRGV